MICLTGDIHHISLKINEQSYIPERRDSEVKIAGRYLQLVEEFGLKATFYESIRTFGHKLFRLSNSTCGACAVP